MKNQERLTFGGEGILIEVIRTKPRPNQCCSDVFCFQAQ